MHTLACTCMLIFDIKIGRSNILSICSTPAGWHKAQDLGLKFLCPSAYSPFQRSLLLLNMSQVPLHIGSRYTGEVSNMKYRYTCTCILEKLRQILKS